MDLTQYQTYVKFLSGPNYSPTLPLKQYRLLKQFPPANKQNLQENILQSVEVLLGKLPQAQFDARERILKAQLRHKEKHDKYYQIESYSIGKKVLRFRSLLVVTHKEKLEE
ncbi:4258_t:CDS:2 [Dentiscutata erythropus]|uniref:4258_t:CDS:1 n=1 Tax=Dentiscutata erythropus TaxID=1348616 RepID=A0A9N9C9N1_9GLOM|nr:4258_t:CDS:2 [Dentiscutata erythropus]